MVNAVADFTYLPISVVEVLVLSTCLCSTAPKEPKQQEYPPTLVTFHCSFPKASHMRTASTVEAIKLLLTLRNTVMPTPIITTLAPAVAPTLWSNIKALFGCAQVAIGTVTTIVNAVDDLAVAAQAQTSIVRDTSLNDVSIKRVDLEERIQARLDKQAADADEAEANSI